MKVWINNFLKKNSDEMLYWISIMTIVLVAIIYGLSFLLIDVTGLEVLKECRLKAMFGIPCPGCGGTRALVSFFRGDVVSSIYYHALVPYSVVIYGIFFISHTLREITKGKIHGMKLRVGYLIGGIVILVVQYILKLTISGYII